ncbi:ubiquitin-specific protease ubp2 [Thoreauomyces humboldtii]|nr:ubiquitin-specific protease ubp2 [Thoreauomyces humboldtii]
MQCISYTRALTQRKELLTAPSSQRSTLTDALLSFLNSMAAQQSVGGGTVNPKPIFSVLSNEWRMYKRMGQQDSHELLRRLLDGVREELMDKSLPKTPSNRVTVIDRIFGGQLCQVIVCDSCKHISYAFEDFLDLSLPIKDEAKESWGLSLLFGRSRKTSAQNSPSSSPVPSPEPDVNRDQLVAIKSTYANDPENLALIDILLAGGSPITVESDPTLQRCLTKFMAVETLQGDAVYSCDSCFKIKYGVTPAEHAKGLKENSQYAPDSRATTPLASEDDQDTESSEMADSQPVGQDTLASQSVTPQSVDHISDPESSPGLDAEDSANDEPADVSKVTHELPFLTIETSEGRKGVLPSDNEDNDSGVLSRRNPRGSNSRPLVQSRAYKRYLIHRTPETLVLHLKRFQQVGFGGRTKKVEDVVAFDEFVDITPFLAPRGAEKAVESDPAVGRTPLLNDRTREAKYRLYGVVVHQGGLFSGHYIAYARVQSPEQRVTVPEEGGDGEESEWTYFSDSSVRPSSWAEVKKAQAYLLFYERWPQSSDPSAA